ncbi:MAG: hypothetical protein V4598_07885 [Bdellovibrionota bacterium]
MNTLAAAILILSLEKNVPAKIGLTKSTLTYMGQDGHKRPFNDGPTSLALRFLLKTGNETEDFIMSQDGIHGKPGFTYTGHEAKEFKLQIQSYDEKHDRINVKVWPVPHSK